MKSIINNKKKLNSNNYRHIIVTQLNESEIKISANGELIKYPSVKQSGKTFTETIDLTNPREVTEEVINYFIRNNKINYMKQNRIPNHNGEYVVFGNYLNGRKISLKVDQSYKDSFELLKLKYNEDRIKFISNCDNIRLIKIYDGRSSEYFVNENRENNYSSNRIYEDEICLHLNLLENKLNELVSYEKEFIKNFLYEKIMNASETERFYLSYSSPFRGFGRIKLKSSSVCIEMPDYMDVYVNKILQQREEYLREINENQLKLKLEMERKI